MANSKRNNVLFTLLVAFVASLTFTIMIDGIINHKTRYDGVTLLSITDDLANGTIEETNNLQELVSSSIEISKLKNTEYVKDIYADTDNILLIIICVMGTIGWAITDIVVNIYSFIIGHLK